MLRSSNERKLRIMKNRLIFAFVRIFTFALVVGTLGTGVVWAEPGKKTVSEIKIEVTDLLREGKYEKACELLDDMKQEEFDPQSTFLQGQCRFGMLDYSAAAFQYQLMLERNTNLPRVRTELARTLQAMGKNKSALSEYERVLSSDIPPIVRRNIQAQLKAIDEHRRWGGVFSLGYMYDSNVNAAPADPNIQAFGLPFVLDGDSTEKSDSAFLGSISFGKYFDGLFGDEWRYDVYGSFLKYASKNDFDSYSVGLSMGPNFYSNVQLYTPFGISTAWEDGHRATQSASFSPSLSRAFSRQLRASGQLSFQYYDDLRPSDESNGWSKGINGNLQYTFNSNNMFEIGLSVLNNDVNELAYNRFVSRTVSVGWHTVIGSGTRVSIQPSYTSLDYDSDDPVDMGIVRDDKRYGMNINIYRDIFVGASTFTPVLSINWTKNESNIDRRDYERKQISLQIRTQF